VGSSWEWLGAALGLLKREAKRLPIGLERGRGGGDHREDSIGEFVHPEGTTQSIALYLI
jgi:hypothetical protein